MGKKRVSMDKSLIAILLLGLAVALPVLSLLVSAVSYHRSLREFQYQLSVATIYATENNTLKAEQGGEAIRVEHHNAFTLFAQFTKDRARERSHAPEKAADLVLTYGNGAVLECWGVRLEETAARKHGVFWCFTSPDDNIWMYDSDAFSIQLLQNAASLAANEPW